MARLFNLEVINGILLGGDESPIYSSTELQGTLGTMDVFHMEITVEAVSENSTTVTVKYETSNDGKTWYAVSGAAKDLTVATAGSGPAGVAWDGRACFAAITPRGAGAGRRKPRAPPILATSRGDRGSSGRGVNAAPHRAQSARATRLAVVM